MRPSLQLIDTATITQHHRNDKVRGVFHKEQDFLKTPAGIRALHTYWNQVKKPSETELVHLGNDTRQQLFPCGRGHSRGNVRRINNVSTTGNLFTESLQS